MLETRNMHAALEEQVAVLNSADVVILRTGNTVALTLLQATSVYFEVKSGKPQIVDSTHLTLTQLKLFNEALASIETSNFCEFHSFFTKLTTHLLLRFVQFKI